MSNPNTTSTQQVPPSWVEFPPKTPYREVVYRTNRPHDVVVEMKAGQWEGFRHIFAVKEILPVAELSRARVVFWTHPEHIVAEIQKIRDAEKERLGTGHRGLVRGLLWFKQKVAEQIDPNEPETYRQMLRSARTMATVTGSVSSLHRVEYRNAAGDLITRSAEWHRGLLIPVTRPGE